MADAIRSAPPLPRLPSEPMLSVPPFSVTPPLNPLSPPSVRVPVPFLTRPPVPVMGFVPPMALSELSAPSVRSAPPLRRRPPPPVTLKKFWLKPFKSTVALELMNSDLLDPNAVALPATSAPALTSVAPEYVLPPVSVSVPVPDFVRLPLPEMTPLAVTLDAPTVSSVPPPAPRIIARDVLKLDVNPSVPALDASPRWTAADPGPRDPSALAITSLLPITVVP